MPEQAAAPRPTCPHSDTEEHGIALAALDANGGNVRRTAAALGISESKLRYWIKKGSGNPAVERIRAKNKRSIRDKFDRLANKLVGVAYRKADDLDAYRATIAACAATDKRLVLDGQPNVIHGTAPTHPALAVLTDDELRALCAQPVTVVDALACGSGGSQPGAEIVHAEVERSAETPGGIETGRPLIMQQPRETALAQAGAAGQLAQAQPAFLEETGERGTEGEGG